jgi:hypothetical protein
MSDIFNLSIKFTDDTPYVELKEIFMELLYSLISNLNIAVIMSKRQNLNSSTLIHPYEHAGELYNQILTNGSDDILIESEFHQIVCSFKTNMSKNKKLGSISNKFSDQYQHMIYFCKYLFIPVRISVSTIPDNLLRILLRVWLSVIMILPFKMDYIHKYSNILYYTDSYIKCLGTLNSIEHINVVMNHFKNTNDLEYKVISKTEATHLKGTHIFVKLFSRLVIHSTIEIMDYFCPNIKKCKEINPNFDGRWLSPFDNDYRQQLNQINKIEQMIYIPISSNIL